MQTYHSEVCGQLNWVHPVLTTLVNVFRGQNIPNIDVREKHGASCFLHAPRPGITCAQTGDGTHRLGMCFDW